MATVKVTNLRKVFDGQDRPVVALDDVSFEASGHTFVSIVGPSGCGKSTLLNILAGVETPSSGRSRSPRTVPGPAWATSSRHHVCSRGAR